MLYNPPLLDILPMYVLFMLLTPSVMLHGLTRGWRGPMACSVLLWLGAQFGLEAAIYEGFARISGLTVPLRETGAFDLVAWQFIWVFGLCLGAGGMRSPTPPFPRWWVRAATLVALVGFGWRHWRGQAPFEHWQHLNMLFDKWRLGPLRLVNLFALVTLVLHHAGTIATYVPRQRWLERLGAASLPVFCAHLVVVLLALALLGPPSNERPLWIDVVLLAATFAILYAVAEVSRLGGEGAAWLGRSKPRAS
jgi:hypothetical protein